MKEEKELSGLESMDELIEDLRLSILKARSLKELGSNDAQATDEMNKKYAECIKFASEIEDYMQKEIAYGKLVEITDTVGYGLL